MAVVFWSRYDDLKLAISLACDSSSITLLTLLGS